MKIHCAFPRLLLQVLPDVLLHEYRSIWFCLYNAMPFLCSETFVFSVNSDFILTGSPACSLGVPIKYIADISKLQTSFLWNLFELRKQLKQLDLARFEASNWLKQLTGYAKFIIITTLGHEIIPQKIGAVGLQQFILRGESSRLLSKHQKFGSESA